MNTNKNINLKINMTGKEYKELLDSQKIKISKPVKDALPWFVFSICLLIVVFWLQMWWFPAPVPEPHHYTWKGILMFLTVAAGIGWIFHGTGFLLVRR